MFSKTVKRGVTLATRFETIHFLMPLLCMCVHTHDTVKPLPQKRKIPGKASADLAEKHAGLYETVAALLMLCFFQHLNYGIRKQFKNRHEAKNFMNNVIDKLISL